MRAMRPTTVPSAALTRAKPATAASGMPSSPGAARAVGKYTSQPVSAAACSCESMSQNFMSAVSPLRKRYSSMKNGTSMPSTESTR